MADFGDLSALPCGVSGIAAQIRSGRARVSGETKHPTENKKVSVTATFDTDVVISLIALGRGRFEIRREVRCEQGDGYSGSSLSSSEETTALV